MQKPIDVLKLYWGHKNFRPLQEDIVDSVTAGYDTLALLPTGGGKSICFQVPGICLEGLTLVISPLIALMKDQVQNLMKRGIAAEAIYSGQHFRDIDRILENAVYGKYKFLYISPERLKTELFQARLGRMNIGLLAIDEAHCISQWGYDFRPPYLEIAEIRKKLPKVPIIALTATATPEVIIDIQDKLAFKNQKVFQKSFERANLTYVVLEEEAKETKLLDILNKVPGSSVVYVRNRRKTAEIANFLALRGIKADFYHAGLDPELRAEKQDAWISGLTRVIVATNAFGMGIDKPDVRTVVHLDIPDNIEAYFQEAGRAGRDEQKAFCVMLYNQKDLEMLDTTFEATYPDWEFVKQVYHSVGSYLHLATGGGIGNSYDFDLVDFIKTFKFDGFQTLAALKMLETEGWLGLTDAVFTAPQIALLVNAPKLYDLQMRDKDADLLIRAVSRIYGGLSSSATKINLKRIASLMKVDEAIVNKILQSLHNDLIIDYKPQKDKAQIFFLQDRLPKDYIAYDQKAFNFRKNRHKFRIEAIKSYIKSTDTCRSVALLSYFGETETKPCGKCDICGERNRQEPSKQEFEYFQKAILHLLAQRDSFTLNELMTHFKNNDLARVRYTLDYMITEGLIHSKGTTISKL